MALIVSDGVCLPVCSILTIYLVSLQEETLDRAKAISQYRAPIMIHCVTAQT